MKKRIAVIAVIVAITILFSSAIIYVTISSINADSRDLEEHIAKAKVKMASLEQTHEVMISLKHSMDNLNGALKGWYGVEKEISLEDRERLDI